MVSGNVDMAVFSRLGGLIEEFERLGGRRLLNAQAGSRLQDFDRCANIKLQ